MKCPLCETEAKINKSENVLTKKVLVRRMTYVCRNKACANYEKEIGIENVELQVKIEE